MFNTVLEKLPKTQFILAASALLFIVVAEIALTCYIPEWREGFYNIMKNKVGSQFLPAIGVFFTLYTSLGFVQGIKVWVGQQVSFYVRTALSKLTLKSFVRSSKQGRVPAYSQAMTGAIQNSTELFLKVLVEIVISASIVISLFIINLDQPIILGVAFVYTLGATLIAWLFQKPLMTTDKEWQETESTYREAIVTIANGKGDFTAKEKFMQLSKAYYRYIRTQMYFQLMSRVKGSLGSIIPYFLLGTAYFNDQLDFGQFMAGIATFELIVINATIFIVMYPDYIKARASQQIIKQFWKEVK